MWSFRNVWIVLLINLFNALNFTESQVYGVYYNESIFSQAQKEALLNEVNRINVKKTVNPCNDFYEYTCGSSMNYAKYMKQVKQNPYDVLVKYFGSDIRLTSAEQKAKDFFLSCTGPHELNKLVQLELYANIGGFPALDQRWIPKKFNLPKALAEFRKIGTSTFIELKIITVNSQNVLYIGPSSKYTTFDGNVQALFYTTMTTNGVPDGRAAGALHEIREFALERDKLIDKKARFEQKDITFEMLKEQIEFEWDEYFEELLGKTLDDSNKIVIRSGSELQNLLYLVREADKKVIADYLWTAFLLDTDKECDKLLENYLPEMYKRLIDCPLFDTNEILTMLNEFESSHEKLRNSKWVTSEDIENSPKIFKAIRDWASYVSAKFEHDFAHLYMDRSNFFRNIVNTGIHRLEEETKDLYRVKNIYPAPIFTLDNFYYLTEQSNYDQLLPMSINYARLGTMFGYYTILPANFSTDWNEEEELKEHQDKLRHCLSQQSLFKNPSKPSGKESADKIFASRGDTTYHTLLLTASFKLAYESYKQWIKDNAPVAAEEDKILKEHHLDNKKLFFLAHASVFCTEEKYLSSAINLEFMNMPEFSAVFHCPLGMPMNPRNKCPVW